MKMDSDEKDAKNSKNSRFAAVIHVPILFRNMFDIQFSRVIFFTFIINVLLCFLFIIHDIIILGYYIFVEIYIGRICMVESGGNLKLETYNIQNISVYTKKINYVQFGFFIIFQLSMSEF